MDEKISNLKIRIQELKKRMNDIIMSDHINSKELFVLGSQVKSNAPEEIKETINALYEFIITIQDGLDSELHTLKKDMVSTQSEILDIKAELLDIICELEHKIKNDMNKKHLNDYKFEIISVIIMIFVILAILNGDQKLMDTLLKFIALL